MRLNLKLYLGLLALVMWPGLVLGFGPGPLPPSVDIPSSARSPHTSQNDYPPTPFASTTTDASNASSATSSTINSFLFGPSGTDLFIAKFGSQAIGEIDTATSNIVTFLNPSQELDGPQLDGLQLESDGITFSDYPSPSWEAVAGLDLM